MAAGDLQIPDTLEQTLVLLAQTQEVYELENQGLTTLSFDGIHDIGDSLERADLHGILSAEELLAIATTLSGARQLRRTIDDHPQLSVLNRLVADLRTYPEIEQEIHRCIDDRAQVADRASTRLGEIRQRQRTVRDQIYQKLQSILQRHSNAVQEQLITKRSDRFVIPVKSPQKDAIPGIVHDSSMSGATLYVEPHSVVELNNKARVLLREEKAEEEAILRALTAKITEVVEDLERLLAIVTILDLATARARYSYWLNANPPTFINRGEEGQTITLRQLRHPLLIWQQQHEDGTAVVPIDLIVQPQIKVVAITGPNTGGKTVTLKTLGLGVLMAKVGLFIPAKVPVELPWFDFVLADIGDEQSLEQSLSTFSGHIRRISRISGSCTPDSLVLLDEVGAGTDPTEGSALAIALLHHLADCSQLTIATTHYGELKALKYEDDRFENASVEFDEASLQPTYRLLWGIPGRSNALTIARRLGLKSEIVDQAANLVAPTGNQDVDRVIAGLESQRKQQETKAQEAGQLLGETERLYREVADKAQSSERTGTATPAVPRTGCCRGDRRCQARNCPSDSALATRQRHGTGCQSSNPGLTGNCRKTSAVQTAKSRQTETGISSQSRRSGADSPNRTNRRSAGSRGRRYGRDCAVWTDENDHRDYRNRIPGWSKSGTPTQKTSRHPNHESLPSSRGSH